MIQKLKDVLEDPEFYRGLKTGLSKALHVPIDKVVIQGRDEGHEETSEQGKELLMAGKADQQKLQAAQRQIQQMQTQMQKMSQKLSDPNVTDESIAEITQAMDDFRAKIDRLT